MNRRIRRSAAAAVRISLLSGGAALSWLALSAGAATADDGGELSSLGSVTSAVETVTAPVEAIVQEVAAPPASKPAAASTSSNQAINVPAVSDVVSSVPQTVADISVVETIAPAIEVIDTGLSEAPIVNAVVPQRTTMTIAQPVLEVVDTAATPVLAPVQEVAAPLIEVVEPVVEVVEPVVRAVDPVVEIVEPVVEVVEPIVEPVTEPIVAVLNPVVQPVVPVATVPASANVVESVVPETVPESLAAEPKFSGAERGAAVSAAPVQLNVDAPGTTQDAPQAPLVAQAAKESADSIGSGASSYGAVQSYGGVHELQGLPSLAFADHQQPTGFQGITAGTANAGASGAGSAGSGTPYAADARFSFLFDLSSAGTSQPGRAAALPTGPSFDPGSTPD